jgi:hypothetical protein
MRKPKLVVIGLDSVSLSLLDHFRRYTPAIRQLMAQGLTGRALPCFPIWTPTNWAALSTGADSSTTGAEGWTNATAGRALSTFDRRAIPCDTIFDAAARAGLSTLALAYPGAHPIPHRRHMVLAPLDRGLVSNGLLPGKIADVQFDRNGTFPFVLVTAPDAAARNSIRRAIGTNENTAGGLREPRTARPDIVQAYLFRAGHSAWRLGLRPDPRKAIRTLRHEVWSDPIRIRLSLAGRPGQCVVRVMVFDGGRRLAVSEAYDTGALGAPPNLAQRVFAALGAPMEHSIFHHEMTRLFSEGRPDSTIMRLARCELFAQVTWFVKAAALTQRCAPYDVLYIHYHYPDDVLHSYLAAAEGSKVYSRKQQTWARDAIAMALTLSDRLVAGLLRLAGDRTTVLLVSDHGNVPNRYGTNIVRYLAESGLTVLNPDGTVNQRRSMAWRSERVNSWIVVNAPRGSRRYATIQTRVVDALLDWKTGTGERVMAVVLRRKDSHLLGYHGRDCGDVTFHYNSGFSWFGCPADKTIARDPRGANHGPQMPVTFSRISDNLAFFVLRDPAVRRGSRWDAERCGPIRLTDLVPTVCHLAGIPPPRTVTGAIRYELVCHRAGGCVRTPGRRAIRT